MTAQLPPNREQSSSLELPRCEEQKTEGQMIITAAEQKGLKYEVNIIEDLSTEGDPYVRYEVGVNYRSWIWCWFTFTNSTENWAQFRETYNQATGVQNKSVRRGWAVKRQLERGLDLWRA